LQAICSALASIRTNESHDLIINGPNGKSTRRGGAYGVNANGQPLKSTNDIDEEKKLAVKRAADENSAERVRSRKKTAGEEQPNSLDECEANEKMELDGVEEPASAPETSDVEMTGEEIKAEAVDDEAADDEAATIKVEGSFPEIRDIPASPNVLSGRAAWGDVEVPPALIPWSAGARCESDEDRSLSPKEKSLSPMNVPPPAKGKKKAAYADDAPIKLKKAVSSSPVVAPKAARPKKAVIIGEEHYEVDGSRRCGARSSRGLCQRRWGTCPYHPTVGNDEATVNGASEQVGQADATNPVVVQTPAVAGRISKRGRPITKKVQPKEEVSPKERGGLKIKKKADWVCCEVCELWRILPEGTKVSDLPDVWRCGMLPLWKSKCGEETDEEESSESSTEEDEDSSSEPEEEPLPEALNRKGRKQEVLELCCGTSAVSDKLALLEPCVNVLATDWSEAAVKMQRLRYSRPNLKFEVADATKITEKLKGRFDVVVLKAAIDAMFDDVKDDGLAAASHALREAHKALISGGICVICCADPTRVELAFKDVADTHAFQRVKREKCPGLTESTSNHIWTYMRLDEPKSKSRKSPPLATPGSVKSDKSNGSPGSENDRRSSRKPVPKEFFSPNSKE